jgi:hypothetical protein
LDEKLGVEDLGATSLVHLLLAQGRGRREAPVPAKCIINNDGRGPFAQFSFPVGGLPKSLDIDRNCIQTLLVHQAIVPTMPLTYPGGKPLTVPSPKSNSGSGKPSPRSQVPQFQVLEGGSTLLNVAPTPMAQKVLDKITDLGFMLQSNLILPK